MVLSGINKMNPDNTKLSDCHNYVTDSTDPNAVKCCVCGKVCTWHPNENLNEQKQPEPTQTTPEDIKTQPEPPQDETNQNDSESSHIRQKEFEFYRVWRNMSPLLKIQSDESLIAAGIEEWMIEIIKLENQNAFAEKFKVNKDTLTIWNKELDEDQFEDRFAWAKHLTKNMLMALYRSALKKASAEQIKIWFQLVENWVPVTETKIEDSRETTKTRNNLYEIMEKWSNDEANKGNSDGGIAGNASA